MATRHEVSASVVSANQRLASLRVMDDILPKEKFVFRMTITQ
jgi:hypothetical protein